MALSLDRLDHLKRVAKDMARRVAEDPAADESEFYLEFGPKTVLALIEAALSLENEGQGSSSLTENSPSGRTTVPSSTGFVSGSCVGEHCFCGAPASTKVEETIFSDDPCYADDGPAGGLPREFRGRHPLTAYICAEHFGQIMRRKV